MFDECKRKWFNRYRFLAFDPATARNLKAEGLLMPFAALVGTIVDDTLKDAFREYKERQVWEIDLFDRARVILKEHIGESLNWVAAAKNEQIPVARWPKASQPIDRIYFGEPITRDEWRSVKERIETCLRNFLESDLREFFMEYHHRHWLCPQRKPKKQRAPVWFPFNGVPVYASYDFMIKAPQETLIVDWKTGNATTGSDKALLQLHWYALYAMEGLGVPPEQIRLLPVWLSAGPLNFRDYTEPVQLELLDKVRDEWRARCEFFDKHVRPYRMRESESLPFFPMTPDVKRCRLCPFRSCEGFSRHLS